MSLTDHPAAGAQPRRPQRPNDSMLLEARVDCPKCKGSYCLPLDGDATRSCPHCGAAAVSPPGVLLVQIPCSRPFRAEAVSQLRLLNAEARSGSPRSKVVETVLLAIATAPYESLANHEKE